MDDIMLNLIVFGVLVVVSGGVFILMRKKQKQEEKKIALLVRQKGWKLDMIRESLAKGFQVTGPHWTLEAVSRSRGLESGPGSSDVEQKTTWVSNQPGSALLVGPRTSQANLGESFEMLMKQIIFTALGEETRGVNQVKIGSPAFQQQFMVWAQDAAEAENFVSPMVQSALLSWKGFPPTIMRTSQGLTIELKNVHLRKPEDLTALVHLGELLS